MAKTTIGDIGDVTVRSCRTCLDSKPTEYVQLDSEDWLDLYKFCVDVKIGQTPLSHLLCADCCRLLRQFSKFKLKCQQSELFWQTLFNKDSKCHLNQPHNDVRIKEEDEAFDIFEYELLDTDVDYSNVTTDSDNHIKSDNNFEVEVKIESKPKNKEHTQNLKSLPRSLSFKTYIDKFSYQNSPKGNGQSNKLATSDFNKTNATEYRGRKSRGLVKTFKGYCNNCKKKYVSKNTLIDHVSSCSGKLPVSDDDLYCGICDSSHNGYTNLNKHLIEHFNNNDLKCQTCDYSGRDFAEMLAHRWLKHSPQGKMNGQCILCGVTKYTILTAVFHFRSEHMHQRGGLCKYCSYTCGNLNTLKKHQLLHETVGYYCSESGCKRRFALRCEMDWHVRNDHAKVNKYICETCGYKTNKLSNFKGHLMIHTKEVAVKCTHCDKTFKSQIHLEMHLRKVALKKRFVCAICAKQYALAKELKRHMKWHSAEKPFTCEQCGKSYKARCHLKSHILISHQGLFPHKCTVCTSEFPTAVRLRRHMSIHTGVRPHECGFCAKGFYGPSMLRKHKQERHGVGIDD